MHGLSLLLAVPCPAFLCPSQMSTWSASPLPSLGRGHRLGDLPPTDHGQPPPALQNPVPCSSSFLHGLDTFCYQAGGLGNSSVLVFRKERTQSRGPTESQPRGLSLSRARGKPLPRQERADAEGGSAPWFLAGSSHGGPPPPALRPSCSHHPLALRWLLHKEPMAGPEPQCE